MSAAVLALVLSAALLHASWNAMVKGAGDRWLALGLVALGHLFAGSVAALFLPLPEPATWLYIAASTIIHLGYYYWLSQAYERGDLSTIYPVARGAAPLLVAAGAWVFVGEALPPAAWAGIAIISTGIFLLARPGRGGGALSAGIVPALLTSLTIAAYSVADGMGVRLASEPLSYIAWLYIAEGFFAFFVLIGWRERARKLSRRAVLTGISGGVISCGAYGLALVAKTMAPLGMVSALRETSVVFAALLGVFLFGEKPRARRLAAAAIVTCGVILVSAG